VRGDEDRAVLRDGRVKKMAEVARVTVLRLCETETWRWDPLPMASLLLRRTSASQH
jgi:hypothetical protein